MVYHNKSDQPRTGRKSTARGCITGNTLGIKTRNPEAMNSAELMNTPRGIR